jgi:hypothetical protein
VAGWLMYVCLFGHDRLFVYEIGELHRLFLVLTFCIFLFLRDGIDDDCGFGWLGCVCLLVSCFHVWIVHLGKSG